MLMKWEDLEPGDELKLTKKFIDGLENSVYKHFFDTKFINKKLVIQEIVIGYYIFIRFKDMPNDVIKMKRDGCFWNHYALKNPKRPAQMFKIERLTNV